VTIRRQEAARYGLAPADVAKALETALQGRTVSQVLEGQRVFDLVVWFDEEARNNIDAIRSTPDQHARRLASRPGNGRRCGATQGPNTINRENVQRRIVMQCNTAGRDLVSVVHDIQAAVEEKIKPISGRLLRRVRRPIRGPAGCQPPLVAAGQFRGGQSSCCFTSASTPGRPRSK
jgi:Cu/Ag efflux pump CusA